MIRRIALILFISAIHPYLLAASIDDWNGHWQGPISLEVNETETESCQVELRMSLDSEALGLREILTEGCGWDMSLQLDRVGSDLFFKDHKVGTVTADKIEFHDVPVEDKGLTYSLYLERQANEKLLYKENTEFFTGLKDRAKGILQPAQ